MVAISLILIGGCSVLRSRTSLRTSGSKVPRRAAACSGHFRSSLSCPQSSVGSTRVRLAICRSPPATPFLLPPASSFPSPRADVAISSGSSHSSSVFRGDRMPRQWTRGKFPPPTIQICVTSLWRGLKHFGHVLSLPLYPLLVLPRNDAAKRNLVHLRRFSRRDEKSKELRSVEVPVVPIHELPRRGLLGNSEGVRRAGTVRPRPLLPVSASVYK